MIHGQRAGCALGGHDRTRIHRPSQPARRSL